MRSDEPLTATVDGEIVMFDTRRSSYFGLDVIGSTVWELLVEPRSIDDLCTLMTERFAVDVDTCRRDLVPFLDDLMSAGLVDSRPDPD